jgi:hypothetical protein
VAQSDAGKEGSRPSAQTYWRGDVGGNGVSPVKQQIAAAHQRKDCHSCVKHQIKYITTDLIVHDTAFNAFKNVVVRVF